MNVKMSFRRNMSCRPEFRGDFFKEDFTMDIDFVVSSNRVKVKIKGVVCFERNIHKIN